MNTQTDSMAADLRDSGKRSRGSAFAARLRERAHSAREGWLQVFGIPDYERYLKHRALNHPGEAVLSRRDFAAQAIDRKYCRSGPRCC
jgi:uncharacterized short protein YbdD (DUF466 family)